MFFRRIVTSFSVVLLVCFGWLTVIATPASAATACDGDILDNAPLFSGWIVSPAYTFSNTHELQDVETAVASLKKAGVTVKVVTSERSFGTGIGVNETLKAFCPEWFDDAGKLLFDYIVFTAVVDSAEAEIVYGSAWEDSLGANDGTNVTEASRIVAKYMVPPFFEWEYSEGFVSAINETHRRIVAPSGTLAPIPPIESGVNEQSSVNVWPYLVVVAILVAIAALAVWRHRRRNHVADT